MLNRFLLLALLALLPLLWACQPAGKAAPGDRQRTDLAAGPQQANGSSQALPPSPGSDEKDYACSYFYFLKGRSAELRQDFEEALEAYENAAICDSKASYAQSKIPFLLLRLGRVHEAALWLHTFLGKHPDSVSLRLLYANILMGQRKTDAALQQYRRILASHPDDPAVTLPLAEIYMAAGRTAEARRILEQELSRDEDSYQAQLLMARLLRRTEDFAASRAHFTRALELNWSADVQAEVAELLIRQHDFAAAEAMYRDIIDREEQNENAYAGLIRLLLQEGREEQALEELLRLRQAPDKPGWVDLSIARYYIRHEQYDEARRILEQRIKRDNSSEARFLLAALLQHEQKYEESLAQVRLIDNKAPEYPEALALMVSLCRQLNRVDDAVLFLERNIAGAITRHPAMYPLLAELHDSQERSAVARKVLEEGLRRYPESEDLLYSYGAFLEQKSEHRAAMDIMQKLVAINPSNAAALNFVGYSWANDGINLQTALDYIQRALELMPDNASIQDSMGWVLYRLGRLDEALPVLEKAAQGSQEPEVQEHLAEVLAARGQHKKALRIYQRLLADSVKAGNESGRLRLQKIIKALEAPDPQAKPVP